MYGWRPDKPDHRDYRWQFARRKYKALPPGVDLRPNGPPVLDQQSLGSCTANAIASEFRFDQRKQGKPDFAPSRLFIYYNERAAEGTIKSDAGAEIRDGIKVINSQGVCDEKKWPYVVKKFATKPPAKCYTEGMKHQSLVYQRVDQTIDQIRGALFSGFPVVFGFTVYDSFEKIGKNGLMPMPKPSESVLGGHAVLMMGYDDSKKRVTVQNSWGTSWGDKGFFYMPYDYVTDNNLCDDFWMIQQVE